MENCCESWTDSVVTAVEQQEKVEKVEPSEESDSPEKRLLNVLWDSVKPGLALDARYYNDEWNL